MKFLVDTDNHRIEVRSDPKQPGAPTITNKYVVSYDLGSPIATAVRLMEKLLKVHERYSHVNSPTAGRTR